MAVNAAELLHELYDYSMLSMRREALGPAMSAYDLESLGHLERLFHAPPSPGAPQFQRRKFRRFDVWIPAVLEDAGFLRDVLITRIGAGGLTLMPAGHLEIGDTAQLRIVEPLTQRHYRLNVRAVWRPHVAQTASIGCSFVTVDSRSPFRPDPPVRLLTQRPR